MDMNFQPENRHEISDVANELPVIMHKYDYFYLNTQIPFWKMNSNDFGSSNVFLNANNLHQS